MKNNKFLRFLCALVLLGVIAACTVKIWIHWPADFLLVPDSLKKSDCIVLLQGDLYPRAKMAAELYKEGYAPAIIVSPLRDGETGNSVYYYFDKLVLGITAVNGFLVTEKSLAYFGKDMQGVYFDAKDCTSTYEEAGEARRIMKEKGFRSLILVTNTYHMRRALMIFSYVFRGSGVEISHVTAPHPIFNPSRWWTKETDVEMISREYLSMIHNFFYHFVLHKGHTSFDS